MTDRTQSPNVNANLPAWDLSDLYHGPEDPVIASDLTSAEEKAVSFEKRYKPLLQDAKTTSPSPLAGLLVDYKEIVTLLTKANVYAFLYFSENESDPARGSFMQKIQTRATEIYTHTLFFQSLWNKLDEAIAHQWLSDPAIALDTHFLNSLRRFAPYTLAEREEKIMALKSNTSSGAFGRLFGEVLSRISFALDKDGTKEVKTQGEILSLLHSPERAVRQAASTSLARGLKTETHVLTYIFNMILADHRTAMKIRSYERPMDPMNLTNEIDAATVANLLESVKRRYPLAQRYFRLKKKVLGLKDFFDYDRYASLESDERPIPFGDCKRIVLEGFSVFGPDTLKIIEQFFDRRWIDAQIRPGKHSGAYCCQTTPSLHPYILCNYTGTVREVSTVAHELGHGLHQYLSRKVGILESDAPLVLAECASVFSEMVIFEKILKGYPDPKKRLALLAAKIDDNIATVFRQVVLTEFEILCHEHGLKHGELQEETISDYWIQANRAMYGDTVTLTDDYRQGWKYIGHFIHTPFYCYAYAFAQLFVLSLYEKFKEDRNSFVPRYLEMLSLGGSRSPRDMAKVVGLNIEDPSFWDQGLNLLEGLILEAEQLAKI